MKVQFHLLFLIFILFSFFDGKGQDNFDHIDKHSLHAPFFVSFSLKPLAHYLTKPTSNDLEKVRAIYFWVSNNIAYDVRLHINHGDKRLSASGILRRGKANSQGYSDLFIALCNEAGIKAFEVKGYAREIDHRENDKLYFDEQLWNAVKVDNEFYLIDITQSSGKLVHKKRLVRKALFKVFRVPYVKSKLKFTKSFDDAYFIMNPEKFVTEILPADPMWQLTYFPVPIDVFEKEANEVIKYQIEKTLFTSDTTLNFQDHLLSFENLPELDKELKTSENAFAFNPKNNKIIGFGYANYANALMKNYKNFQRINLDSKINGYHEALKYYNGAIKYLINFKKDNNQINKTKLNRIFARNEIVNTKIASVKNSNLDRIKENLSNIQKRKQEMVKLSIEVYTSKQKSNNFYKESSNQTTKYKITPFEDTLKYKELKLSITSNESLIKKYEDSILFISDSLLKIYLKVDRNYRKINEFQLEKSKLIALNTELNSRMVNLNYLLEGHLLIEKTSLSIDSLLKANENLRRSKIGILVKQRDDYNKVIFSLIKKNQELLRSLKKHNLFLEQDNITWEYENMKYREALQVSLKKYFESLVIDKNEIQRLKEECKIIKKENKLLVVYKKVEDLRLNIEYSREDSRFKANNKKAEKLLSNCHTNITLINNYFKNFKHSN